jgi:hypothetical protein
MNGNAQKIQHMNLFFIKKTKHNTIFYFIFSFPVSLAHTFVISEAWFWLELRGTSKWQKGPIRGNVGPTLTKKYLHPLVLETPKIKKKVAFPPPLALRQPPVLRPEGGGT